MPKELDDRFGRTSPTRKSPQATVGRIRFRVLPATILVFVGALMLLYGVSVSTGLAVMSTGDPYYGQEQPVRYGRMLPHGIASTATGIALVTASVLLFSGRWGYFAITMAIVGGLTMASRWLDPL